ncbi:MAG: hypothetical protein DDG59_13475 [Anaerolineae bacterium]|jgi:uncharacterized repeat protein (TIGR01451 family)|nr:MAG: hypothetical protein DDG59_13475 [Anaerolineae bacterium]
MIGRPTKAIFPLSFWFLSIFLAVGLAFAPATVQRATAEGSRELYANGGKRALTEWRTNTTAGLYRRTFFRVYARAGEQILMGSSAVGVGQGDIVLYRPEQISSSQISPTALNSITPEFKCSTYRLSNPGAGQLNTRAKELAGPLPNSGGYLPCVYTVNQTGVYWVAMYGPDGANGSADGDAGTIDAPNVGTGQRSGVSMWDITVRSPSGQEIAGRVFVDYLAQITAGNGPSRRVYSTVYAVTTDGFIYRVDFRGLDPNGYIFYGNRVGFFDPDGKTPLYHDVVGTDNQLTTLLGGVKLAPAEAKIFFQPPAADLPADLLPVPAAPAISNVAFQGSAGGQNAYYASGGIFTYQGTIGGINQIVISRDGTNFDPTKAENRVIYAQAVAGVNTVEWDGKDNAGNPFPVGNYQYKMSFHAGEYHFPMLDVENSMLGGPTITLLNPINGVCPFATCRHAFYDDRGYRLSTGATVGTPGVILPGIGAPSVPYSDPVNGFDTASSQRAFGNDSGNGFGDRKGLDLWAYYPIEPITNALSVIPQATQDLRITKTASGDFTIGASGGTFWLTVSNASTSEVPGEVTVTDTLLASLTLRNASGSGWSCDVNAQTLTCKHPNSSGLNLGASLSPIQVVVDVSPSAAPQVSNTATLSSSYDSNPANNTYTTTVNVQSADLEVLKTVDRSNPAEGESVTYTITVTNKGPNDASGITISDLLPASLTYQSHSTNNGTYQASNGEWNLGNLPNQAFATLTITAKVNSFTAGQTIQNTATRTASSPYDYNALNDSASVSLTVRPTVLQGFVTDAASGAPIAGATVTVVDAQNQTYQVTTDHNGFYQISGLAHGNATLSVSHPQYQDSGSIFKEVQSGAVNTQNIELKNADLVVTKSNGKTAVQLEDTLVYTITVQNTGSLAASGVVITDTMASSLKYLNCSPACSNVGQQVVWSLSDPILPGESITLNLTAWLTSTQSITQTYNYVFASTTAPESDITDNEVSDKDPLVSAPDLAIDISDAKTTVLAGEGITYTLNYRNVGNHTSGNITITVQLPPDFVFDWAEGDPQYDSNYHSLTWQLGPLENGRAASLSFKGRVAQQAAAETILTAFASITDDGTQGADTDASNNTASDNDRVLRPLVSLTKAMSTPARVGEPVTVTLKYENAADVVARTVVVTDTLPSHTTYVENSCQPSASCTFSNNQVTWNLGDLQPHASGELSFAFIPTVDAGGAATASEASFGRAGDGGEVEIKSLREASYLKGIWQDKNPLGPSGWNLNPRQANFDDSAWQAVITATEEIYWFNENLLGADWIAVNRQDQLDPNYTFFRAKACVPLNAVGIQTSLTLAGDDVSDIYLNGVYLGQQIGGGGVSVFDHAEAAQPGLNLLAVRLLNNRHGGHAALGGEDHPGLLFDLNLNWQATRSFVSVPRVVKAGQAITFQVEPSHLGGVAPFEYRFEFGDSTDQDYSSNSTATHTYSTAGHYSATVRVRDAGGCEAVESIPIQVVSSEANLITNRAELTYRSETGLDYQTSSGTAVDLPLVDLLLSKSSSPTPLVPGEVMTYTLTVTNKSPRTLTQLTLFDPLPSALIAPSYLPSAGDYDPQSGLWSGFSLKQNESLMLTIRGQLDPLYVGELSNTASVSSEQASEKSPDDNRATDTQTVNRYADLGVQVSGIQNGRWITYTITIDHHAISGLTEFTLSDVLPSVVSNPTYIPSIGEYDPSTDTWSNLTFLTGDQLVLTVVGILPPNYQSDGITYQVEVKTPSNTPDPISSNNTAKYTMAIDPTFVQLLSFRATSPESSLGWMALLTLVLIVPANHYLLGILRPRRRN